jgi:hypothetical protein
VQGLLDPRLARELQIEAAILDDLDANLERCWNAIIARGEGRRRLRMEELATLGDVRPEFEHRFEIGYKLRQAHPRLRLPNAFWFYTLTGMVGRELVVGALIGDDMIVVEAADREQADKRAAEGLRDTLEIAREIKHNPLLLPGANPTPADGTELEVGGRRAQRGAPLREDIRQKVARIMADRVKAKHG